MDLRTKLLTRRTVQAVPLGEDLQAFVRVMTTNELLDMQDRVKADGLTDVQAAALMVCKTVCSEDGNRLFQDADLPTVQTMDVGVLVALAAASAEANTLGKKKASPATSGSPSDSPPSSA